MKILVTGGAGFIGSNFIHYILENREDEIINLDKLTYAGNLENLNDIGNNPRYSFIQGDICDRDLVKKIINKGVEYIINFAAESHVDRSIEDPGVFIKTNVEGTGVLLEAARKSGIKKFIQISTDEVYGSLGETGLFTEENPLAPSSPYSASKAGADLLVKSYYTTFGMDINITRSSNNFGPCQFPEKLIPLLISNLLQDKKIPIYGDGKNIRDWLYVRDHCQAIELVMTEGKSGEIYNIGGGHEKTNLEIARMILQELDRSEAMISFVKDRPGHDRRYALDCGKIKSELGWEPDPSFESRLRETVKWYIDNRSWWERRKS